MRHPPAFWARPPGLLSELLLPAGAVWDAAGRLRRAIVRPYHPPVPVMCVGNLVAGGAGKTPVALGLAAYLSSHGVALHFVTRGYGGYLSGPVRVDPARHDFTAVGDEALLLAACAPCWVARDRAAGARAAVAAGAQMILLDDGFQNPGIVKNLSLLVVDCSYGFGNGRVIPAGPLRESLCRGLARADAVVFLGTEPQPDIPESPGTGEALPVLRALVRPLAGKRLAGARLFAFAGIARPVKFFATLQKLGVELVGSRSFPDHHPFRAEEIRELLHAAEQAQARLITTAKDMVRIPPTMRSSIMVLEIEIRWRDPASLGEVVRPILLSALSASSDLPRYARLANPQCVRNGTQPVPVAPSVPRGQAAG